MKTHLLRSKLRARVAALAGRGAPSAGRPSEPTTGSPSLGATLRDPALERTLCEEGSVVVDLLSPEAVRDLLDTCRSLHPDGGAGWESDFHHPDPEVKGAIDRAVSEALAPGIAACTVGHRTIVHSFIVNWPGPEGGLGLHQDPTFVDPSRYRSVLIWCALTDADEGNGTLHIVRRSHGLQHGPQPQQAPSWSAPHTDLLLRDHLSSVTLRAGQALVFDCRLLHCSFANESDAPRVTAAALLLPDGADPWILDLEDDDRLLAYRLDPRFFIDHRQHFGVYAKPSGLDLLATLPWEPTIVTEADLAGALPPGTCTHERP